MKKHDLSSLSDTDIIQLYLDLACRDTELFRELYDRHKRRVYVICRTILRDDEGALDLTQDVFRRAYEALPRFRNENFEGWLVEIARNVSLRELDKRIRRREISLDEEVAMPLAPEFLLRPDVQQVLGLLPERQRRAINLIDSGGYSYREAAEATGCSENEMRSSLQYGRQRFRQIWREAGGRRK
jgi:RNA polymerase sigma-70 factor (ECF subfamily)